MDDILLRVTRLFYDENGVGQLLSLEERMEIGQKRLQMNVSIAKRDDDGHVETRSTFGRFVAAAHLYHRAFTDESLGYKIQNPSAILISPNNLC